MRQPFSTLAKHLVLHERSPVLVEVDRQLVADGALVRGSSIVDLELNWAALSGGSETLEAAPLLHVTGGLDIRREAVGDEAEGIEQCALPHAVAPDDDRERGQRRPLRLTGQAAQGHIPQGAVVFYAKAFDAAFEGRLACPGAIRIAAGVPRRT
jgi:hypothetical protein